MPLVRQYFDKVILLIIVISVMPAVVQAFKAHQASRAKVPVK